MMCSCPEGWDLTPVPGFAPVHHRDCVSRITPDPALNVERMEAAADKLVDLGTELGLNRKEMGSACLAIAANHMIVTGVTEERAVEAMVGMYRWRRKGINEKLLVKP